jgi:hypothetical protein
VPAVILETDKQAKVQNERAAILETNQKVEGSVHKELFVVRGR